MNIIDLKSPNQKWISTCFNHLTNMNMNPDCMNQTQVPCVLEPDSEFWLWEEIGKYWEYFGYDPVVCTKVWLLLNCKPLISLWFSWKKHFISSLCFIRKLTTRSNWVTRLLFPVSRECRAAAGWSRAMGCVLANSTSDPACCMSGYSIVTWFAVDLSLWYILMAGAWIRYDMVFCRHGVYVYTPELQC